MVNLGQAIGYLDLDTTGFKRGFNSALGDLKILRDQSATTSDKFAAVGHSMTTVGSSLTKLVTVPLVGAGAASVKFAADFDNGLKKVSTIADTSVKSIDSIGKEVLALSSDVNISADDLNEALYQTLSATNDTANAIEYLETASKLAKGGFTDVTMAVDGATSVMNAYGLTGKEAFEKIADTMITTQNVGKTTVDELAKSLFQVIPTAASLGVSFDEVSAALAAITAQGTPTSVATTQMRQLFIELSKDGGKAADTFKEMSGKTFKDFIASGGSVADALGLMEKAAEKDGKALADMFGSVEAGAAALQLTGTGGEKFASALDAMGESAGATDEAFKKMSESAGDQFSRVINNLNNIAIQFGTIILPYVLKLTDGLGNFVKKLVDMDEGTKKTIVTVLGIVAALGPVLLIGGKIASGISTIMTTLSSLGAAAAAAGTTVGASIAAIALPVTAVIAAIVALYFAWKNNFGGIQDTTKEIFASIKELIDIFWGWLTAIWESNLMGIQDWWNLIWVAIEKTFEQVFDAIKTFFGVWVAIFKGDFEGAWNILVEFWGRTWERVKEVFSAWWDAWSTTFMQVWNAIYEFFKGIWDAIVQWFKDAWDSIISFFTETVPAWIDSVIEFFAQLPYNLGVFVGEMIGHVLNFGKEIWSWVTTELPKIIQNIIDWFAKLPSEIWNWLKKIIDNILDWGKQSIAKAYEAAKNIWNAIVDWIKRLPAEISKWFTDVLNYLKGLPAQMLKIGEDIISGLWNGLKNMWNSVSDWFTGVIDSIKDFFKGVKDGMDNVRNETSKSAAPKPKSSNASGLDYVPYNGYIAELHEGERVLTAEEAKSQGKSEGDTYNFYSPVALTPVESAREMKKAKQELALGFV